MSIKFNLIAGLFLFSFDASYAREEKYVFAAHKSGEKLVAIDFGWTKSPLLGKSPESLLVLDRNGFSKGTFVRNEEKCQVLCAQADDPVCHIEAIYKMDKPVGTDLMGILEEGEVSNFKSVKVKSIPVSDWLKSVDLSAFKPVEVHFDSSFFLSIVKHKDGHSQLLRKKHLDRGKTIEIEKNIERNCHAFRFAELSTLRCKEQLLILEGNNVVYEAPLEIASPKFDPMATFVRNNMIHYVLHWSDDEDGWITVLVKTPNGWKYLYAGGGYPKTC